MEYVILIGVVLCIIGFVLVLSDDDKSMQFMGCILIFISSTLIVGPFISENNIENTYKKSFFNNPYEYKILYERTNDSTLVPKDTVYQLKTLKK